jgi:hypothetical protein
MTVVNLSLVTHPIAISVNRIDISRVKARYQLVGRDYAVHTDINHGILNGNPEIVA